MTEYLESREDGIAFRFAQTDDKEAIYAFALEAIAGADLPAFAEDAGHNLQERIENGNPKDLLLAIDTGESNSIVAYIELIPVKSDDERVKVIKGIFVLPKYRRRGIGKYILKLVQTNCVEDGVQLRIKAFTEEGRKFWQAYGFKIHHYSLYLDS